MHPALTPVPAAAKVPALHVPEPALEVVPARQYFPPGQAVHCAVVPDPSVENDPGEQVEVPVAPSRQ